MKQLSKQIEIIQQISELTFQEIIFDSNQHNWKQGTSEFDEKIINKSNLCIFIEDEENNQFGIIIKSPIKYYTYFENEIQKGYSNVDNEMILFSLQSNGRSDIPMSFEIQEDKIGNAFWLFPKEEERLFVVGGCDISIGKENSKDKCWCYQYSFHYHSMKQILVGKEGPQNPFTVKRILVFQMYETDEQMLMKYKRIILEEERNKLDKMYEETMKNYSNEIKILEEWTNSEFQYVVFDSEKCVWEQFLSTFDKHVFGKKELIFYIEDTNDNAFGAYIHNPITHYWNINGDNINSDSNNSNGKMSDYYSFIFSMKSNGRCKQPTFFEINPKYSTNVFNLFSDEDWSLFSIGGNDILIPKQNIQNLCFSKQTYFNYGSYQNVLTGNDKFTLKRLQVWQMKNKEEIIDEERQMMMENEIDLMKIENESIMKEFEKEITQISEWNSLKPQEIMFDSTICQWEQNNSNFIHHFARCNLNVTILIQTENDEICGFHISSKNTDGKLELEKAFVFLFNQTLKKKFDIKEEMKHLTIIHFFNENEENLCLFGNNELCVGKKGKKLIWKKQNVCFFDLDEFENDLECEIKRVILIQFN